MALFSLKSSILMPWKGKKRTECLPYLLILDTMDKNLNFAIKSLNGLNKNSRIIKWSFNWEWKLMVVE